MDNRSVLVTGATGIVGSHICAQLLREGRKVRAIRRNQTSLKRLELVLRHYFPDQSQMIQQIEWVEGDVRDIFSLLDAMKGVQVVYHAAGVVSFDDADAPLLMKVNAEGTANVVNAALESGIECLCHVSSVAVLPNIDEVDVVDEHIHWKSSPKHSLYSISKYNGEREVWRAREEGMNVIVVNPSIVIGPGAFGSSSGRLVEQAEKGFPFYSEGTTGYVDARDVAKAMVSLETKKIYGERFVLNSGNASYLSVFTAFNKEFGHKAPAMRAGKWMMRIALVYESLRKMISGKEKRLTKNSMRSALSHNKFSSAKITKRLQFEFISIEKSIHDTCEFYKTYKQEILAD